MNRSLLGGLTAALHGSYVLEDSSGHSCGKWRGTEDIMKTISAGSRHLRSVSSSIRHDNHAKHTAEIVKLWLLYNVPNQLHMSPQSSDLNPTEHL
ncbi:hypothetical protein TNCV_3552931 [Trichonephila clavipes]|nr:hypothetical protein TNCV_3552931 [Trichonephila clavipes]